MNTLSTDLRNLVSKKLGRKVSVSQVYFPVFDWDGKKGVLCLLGNVNECDGSMKWAKERIVDGRTFTKKHNGRIMTATEIIDGQQKLSYNLKKVLKRLTTK